MQALIRLLYALLIACSVVAFVGFGTYSLYEPPKDIDYSNNYDYSDDYDSPYQIQERKIDKQRDQYDKDVKTYHRNVTYIVLASSAIFTVLGLLLYRKSDVFGEGLALGGIATSIYAIVAASDAEARILRFLAVTLLLVSALLLTYRRFYGKSQHKT
jgi:ABC-type Fe3+ transport system permease subunit